MRIGRRSCRPMQRRTMTRRQPVRQCRPQTSRTTSAQRPATSKPAAATKPATTNKQAAKSSNPFYNKPGVSKPSTPPEAQKILDKYSNGCYGTPLDRKVGYGTYEQAATKAAKRMNPELDKTVDKVGNYIKGDEFTDWFKGKLDKGGMGAVTGENRPKFEKEVEQKIQRFMDKEGETARLNNLAAGYGEQAVYGQLNSKGRAHSDGTSFAARMAQRRPNGIIGREFRSQKAQSEATATRAMTPVLENYIKSYIGGKVNPMVESRLTQVGTQHTISNMGKNLTDGIGSLFNKLKGQ